MKPTKHNNNQQQQQKQPPSPVSTSLKIMGRQTTGFNKLWIPGGTDNMLISWLLRPCMLKIIEQSIVNQQGLYAFEIKLLI